MMIDDILAKKPEPRVREWLNDVRQAAIDARDAGITDPDDYEGLTPYADKVSTGFDMRDAKYLALAMEIDEWDIGTVCSAEEHRHDEAELQLYMLAHVLLPEFLQRESQ